MLTKIKRQDCLDQYQTFPLSAYNDAKDEEEYFFPEVYMSYVLMLQAKSFKGLVKSLGTEVVKLAKAFHSESLTFLGDTDIPWLYRNGDYKPVKEALDYLIANKIGRRFNGAIQVDITELATFIKHLAWLVRCNAVLPYFHFNDEGQNIVGSVCQYGNLHLSTLNEAADELLQEFVKSSKFEYGDSNSCNNWDGKTSAISGRKTMT